MKYIAIFLISTIESILVVLTLGGFSRNFGDFIYYGFPLPIQKGVWETGYNFYFLPNGFLTDWLVFTVILFGLFVFLKSFWSKKVMVVIAIVLFLSGIVLNAKKMILEIKGLSSCENSVFKNEDEIKANEILANLPANKLFYFYNGKKVYLSVKKGICGVYVESANNSQTYITNKLSVGFVKGFPQEKIDEIAKAEGLTSSNRYEYGRKISLLFTTTDLSKYLDGLEMSNYLLEKYEVFQFAEPAMMTTSGDSSLLSSVVSWWKNSQNLGDKNVEQVVRDSSPTNDDSNKMYVEGLGVVVEDSNHKYIPELKTVIDNNPKTLKQYLNIVMTGYKLADLDTEIVNYILIKTDQDGKSPLISLLLYSKSQNKFYRFSDDGQDYVTKIGEENSVYYPLKISKIIDSPEIVQQAIEKKGACQKTIEIMYLGNLEGDSGKVSVNCSEGWGVMLNPMK